MYVLSKLTFLSYLQVCKNQQTHDEVCLGLLMGVLTEPDNAARVIFFEI